MQQYSPLLKYVDNRSDACIRLAPFLSCAISNLFWNGNLILLSQQGLGEWVEPAFVRKSTTQLRLFFWRSSLYSLLSIPYRKKKARYVRHTRGSSVRIKVREKRLGLVREILGKMGLGSHF